MRLTWDKYFLAMAKLAASRSGCNSRPTGAVIVFNHRILATGYNGSLPGQPQCTDNGDKYCLRRLMLPDDSGDKKYVECPSIHGEQNAINQMVIQSSKIPSGSILYCTLKPCIICLKNIASVGIREVVFELEYESDDKERDSFWKDKFEEYGINARQVTLSNEDKDLIVGIMLYKTSKRRL